MADVFLSYAREDADRARDIATTLEGHRLSVWWDRDIPPGRTFDEVIEEEIAAANCVVVLWSAISCESRWVRTEAAEASDRGVLVPALIEPGIRIPLAFRRIHAADLSSWLGEGHGHSGLDDLIAAVAVMAGVSPAPRGMISNAEPAPSDHTFTAPGARLPQTSMRPTEFAASVAVAALPILVGGWFLGPVVGAEGGLLWLIRANTWIFGSLCLAALVVLLEGISVRPSVVGVFGRARQRPLRWIAALSWALAIALPLAVLLTGG